MNRLLNTFILIIIGFTLIEAKCERKSSVYDVKTYKINLDLAPIDRFKEVTIDFKNEILELFEAKRKSLGKILMPLVDLIGYEIENILPYPFNDEIKGISKYLNTSLGEVVLFQIIYDLTANEQRHKKMCTSILSRNEDGQIIHGRNLDYDFPELLQKLVYKAQFYRNGTLIFTSAQFAGHIGINTGHKENAFTFSINERNKGAWWLNVYYGLFDKRAAPLSFITRNLMENITNFNDAVNLMAKSDLIAPAYFIIGGVKPDEAVILTRNQTAVVDDWRLNPNSSKFNRWFLIETNYDHWTEPPAKDNRRDPAIDAMNTISQKKISFDKMFDVLSLNPICNKETAYSVVMSAIENNTKGFKIIVH